MKIHVAYHYDHCGSQTRKYIADALLLAEFSNCKNRHGCLIIKSGRVVGRGWNKSRNDPNNLSPEHILTGASVHAEDMALRMAGDQAKGADLYVVRLGARNTPLLSRPCNLCYRKSISAGIAEIYHT